MKDAALLESVQRHATKWMLNEHNSDYKTRLRALHLHPLMMVYELNDCLLTFLNTYPSVHYPLTPLVKVATSLLTHQQISAFFFPHFPHLWNSLPSLDPNFSPAQATWFLKICFGHILLLILIPLTYVPFLIDALAINVFLPHLHLVLVNGLFWQPVLGLSFSILPFLTCITHLLPCFWVL